MPKKPSPYPNDAYLDPRLEADLITRLNRAEGHLRSVKQMLTNGCVHELSVSFRQSLLQFVGYDWSCLNTPD
jgi:hypothetical protein